MRGSEFLRRLRRLTRERGQTLREETKRGKGSHTTLYLGTRKAVLKDKKKEIGEGLLRAMCDQLGVDRKEL